jgi:tryptophan halogenase
MEIAIIGRGTAGAQAALYFLKNTDWNIDWYYDSKTPTQAVGEGSQTDFPGVLNNLGFNFQDLKYIDGTLKGGIKKANWGMGSEDFMHPFYPGTHGYHFNAVKLQEYIFNILKNQKRIRIIDSNLIKHEDAHTDFVFDCSGVPKPELLKREFIQLETIPVNSVYVTQCPWEYSQFQHTITDAQAHGWVFGIPLTNRCSIGYMYNNETSTLEEVKQDVLEVFNRYSLTPGNVTNNFSFNSYYRKINFFDNVAFNGNASFFLEPLEATSITCINMIQTMALNVWTKKMSMEEANFQYTRLIKGVENMAMLHYFRNKKYQTKFWKKATVQSRAHLETAVKEIEFGKIVRESIDPLYHSKQHNPILGGYGTWSLDSYQWNITQLGIKEELKNLLK